MACEHDAIEAKSLAALPPATILVASVAPADSRIARASSGESENTKKRAVGVDRLIIAIAFT
jgi:hypothetical protein